MKNCGRRNVREHKEIKGSDKNVTLDISSKFEILDKMKITSSESKRKLERSGKELIISLGFRAKVRLQKYKTARYVIENFSEKDLSKMIRDFERFYKLPNEKKRPKHKPTDRYSYLARQLTKYMMRVDTLNWNNYGGYTEITVPSSNVYSTDEDESRRIIVHKKLLHNCSVDKDK